MWKIDNIEINNPLVIAPMAGISNAAFRSICYNFKAGLVYSEMVSDKALHYKDEKTKELLISYDEEHPLTMQIFGKDIDTMVEAAIYLDTQTNCDIIDINMGCPANKIVKSGGGSNLLREPEHAINIVKNIVKAVNKPVTVKMRLGYDHNNINYLYLAKEFEKVGAKAIALHARTKSDLYQGKANWEHIKLLKQELNIPVIGNGDIRSLEDYIKYKEYTKCDAIMIGRGVLGNPFLIKEIVDYENKSEHNTPTYVEKVNMCLQHATKLIELKGERIAMKQMRGIAPWYLTGIPYSTKVKTKFTKIVKYEDLKTIIDDYIISLKEHNNY